MDLIYVLSWWLLVEILGLAALPVAWRTLRWLPERGYAFSKTLGLLIAAYLLWIGAMTGFVRNDSGGILFVFLIMLGIAAFFLFKDAAYTDILEFIQKNKGTVIAVEIIFGLAFFAWVVLRAYAPDKVMNAGGEKFMEMAFLNGVLNSPRFPPLDPWLSGFAISYYYFGYVMMGMLTRISGAPAGIGFELYDALLFSLTAIGVYGVVYNLVSAGNAHSRRQPLFYGFFGSVIVLIMGNLEGLLESVYSRGIISDQFWKWLDIPGLLGSGVNGSWSPGGGFFGCCWRASRVLQDYDLHGAPLGISPITEFPMFSFLLGDNHPHVLALPFVLLCIALAFSLLLRQVSRIPENSFYNSDEVKSGWNRLRVAFNDLMGIREHNISGWMLLLFYAFCIGALGFLNTWDMPIYLGLVVFAYAIGEYIRNRRIDGDLVLRVVLLGFLLLFGSIALYTLFYVGFGSQAGGILPYIYKPTRVPQYLVMFGVFIYILFWFLIVSMIFRARQTGIKPVLRAFLLAWGWIVLVCLLVIALLVVAIIFAAGVGKIDNQLIQNLVGAETIIDGLQRFVGARLANPWLFLLLTGMLAMAIANISQPSAERSEKLANNNSLEDTSQSSTAFALLLIVLGVALTLSVELFYLRDSFGVRMNTVFKFYYQAWVMFGCASAYATWWLLNRNGQVNLRIVKVVFLTGAVLLIAGGLVYSLIGIDARVGGFRGQPNLDGVSNLARDNPDDWAVINWLQSNPVSTILEAPGKSYNYEGRISAFSGFPTLLGWALHEGQWRGNYDEQGKREPDIQTIYTTRSGDLALELLRKWKIDYVVVGSSEINYIQQLCSEASRACNLSRALGKFDEKLIPVFEQGNAKIYKVP